MPSRAHNFELWKGDTRTLRLRLKQKLSNGTLAPVDLTGTEVQFIATWEGGGFDLSSVGGPIAVNAVTAEITIPLTVQQIDGMPTGDSAEYRLKTVLAGEVRTVAFGNLLVKAWAPSNG